MRRLYLHNRIIQQSHWPRLMIMRNHHRHSSSFNSVFCRCGWFKNSLFLLSSIDWKTGSRLCRSSWRKNFNTVHEKCLNTELFLVRGKYGPEITLYLDIFHAVNIDNKSIEIKWLITDVRFLRRFGRVFSSKKIDFFCLKCPKIALKCNGYR